MRYPSHLIGSLLSLALVAGCGGATTPSPAAPTAAPTATALPAATATTLPAATLVPTASPAPPTPAAPTSPTPNYLLATSAGEIAGNWLGLGPDGLYERFNLDGTCYLAASLETLTTAPKATCTFSFEGTTLSLTQVSVFGLPSCGSKAGTYRVRILDKNRMQLVKVVDACNGRVNSMATVHERQP